MTTLHYKLFNTNGDYMNGTLIGNDIDEIMNTLQRTYFQSKYEHIEITRVRNSEV